MRQPLINRDPGDEQQTLEQDPGYCPACETTRASLCGHDADIHHGRKTASSKRPAACLNAYDPATAPFPEGF